MVLLSRPLTTLPLAADAAVLQALPALQDALTGHGDARLPVPAGEDTTARRYADVFAAGTALGRTEDDDGDPTAFVVATSGSTAEPKGTLLAGAALRASISATDERLGGPGGWLLALPPWHVAGLQVLLRSVVAGTEPTVLDLAQPFTPEAFVAAARRCTGARRYVSLVPTQLRRVLDEPAATAALADFDAVLVGAAATPSSLRQAAAQAGVRIVTTYGMTETCGGCVYDGRALRGVDVALTDGRITLGGTVIGRGYRGRPALTAEVFRGGRFGTGDLGRLTDDGTLTVLGRADDVIVTGGVNVSPREVEDLVLAHPSVRDVSVVGAPDTDWGQRVVAVVVAADPTRPPSLVDLRRHVLAAAVRELAPRHLVVLDTLPLLPSGKPDRAELARLAAQQGTRIHRSD